MSDVVEHLRTHLVTMRVRMRRSFVTFREYMDPEYQKKLKDGMDEYEAKAIAGFVKEAAVGARMPELIGLAEMVLRAARDLSEKHPTLDHDPSDPNPETARHGTQAAEFWEPYARRAAEREEEHRRLETRWQSRDMVTTSDIAARVSPPWFSTTQIFGLLKELGYVSGLPREYELTPKGAALGEVRGSPEKPGRIYWKKELFDLVQAEIHRRRRENKWLSLPHPRNVT